MELDLFADIVELTRAVIDVESVSGNERELADLVESALSAQDHLEVFRDGDAVVASTRLGRPRRVVIAGHLDTVPVAGNLPSWVEGDRIFGRGSCDMKGGVAVALSVAAATRAPRHDVTWIFYDNEEVEASRNGLGRLARNHPELLVGDFAVLMEPTSARIEGGCQGTLRAVVTTRGRAAHSARSWLGENAIHSARAILERLADYQPRRVMVEGLEYREGLNAVGISGGVAGNVIPDRCDVTVNFRFAPDRDEEDARANVADVFSGFEVEVVDFAPAARPGLDADLAASFVTAVGGEPVAKFGWTDVARFAGLGVPAVNYGPGDPGKAHADDEFCPIPDLHSCRDGLIRWLN